MPTGYINLHQNASSLPRAYLSQRIENGIIGGPSCQVAKLPTLEELATWQLGSEMAIDRKEAGGWAQCHGSG
jgi:hypothetical protein